MTRLVVSFAIFPGLLLIPLYLVGWARTPFQLIVVGLLLFLVEGVLWLSTLLPDRAEMMAQLSGRAQGRVLYFKVVRCRLTSA